MKLKHCFQRAAAVMACLMLFCNVASAAEPARPSYKELTGDQLDQLCSLTLTYKEGDTVLPQTTFTLYKVATINEQLQFKLTEGFKAEQIVGYFNEINTPNFNNWGTIATSIQGYASTHTEELGGTTKQSNADGVLSFTGLETGLYYLIGEQTGGAPGTYRYTPTPIMLVLPSWDGEDWDFNVTGGTGKFGQQYVDPIVIPPQTVSRRVVKVWDDEGYENRRPESIQVQLIGDGEVYDTATMTADSRWAAVQWDGLDANVNWQVAEVLNSTRYTPSIVRDDTTGITFVITNTYNRPGGGDPDDPDEPGGGGGTEVPDPEVPTTDIDDPDTPRTDNPGLPDDPGVPEEPVEEIEDPDVPLSDLPDLPQTGQLWWPVPLLAVGGVAMILTGLIRRRDGSCGQ